MCFAKGLTYKRSSLVFNSSLTTIIDGFKCGDEIHTTHKSVVSSQTKAVHLPPPPPAVVLKFKAQDTAPRGRRGQGFV